MSPGMSTAGCLAESFQRSATDWEELNVGPGSATLFTSPNQNVEDTVAIAALLGIRGGMSGVLPLAYILDRARFDPLKVYLFHEGLVRLATERYTLNSKTRLPKRAYIDLSMSWVILWGGI